MTPAHGWYTIMSATLAVPHVQPQTREGNYISVWCLKMPVSEPKSRPSLPLLHSHKKELTLCKTQCSARSFECCSSAKQTKFILALHLRNVRHRQDSGFVNTLFLGIFLLFFNACYHTSHPLYVGFDNLPETARNILLTYLSTKHWEIHLRRCCELDGFFLPASLGQHHEDRCTPGWIFS